MPDISIICTSIRKGRSLAGQAECSAHPLNRASECRALRERSSDLVRLPQPSSRETRNAYQLGLRHAGDRPQHPLSGCLSRLWLTDFGRQLIFSRASTNRRQSSEPPKTVQGRSIEVPAHKCASQRHLLDHQKFFDSHEGRSSATVVFVVVRVRL